MTAISPPALTSARPWSAQSEIRCVPTRPLVVKPQTKNEPNSTQNIRVLLASTRAVSALRSGLGLKGAVTAASVAP